MGPRCHLVIVAESAKSNCTLLLADSAERETGKTGFHGNHRREGGGGQEREARARTNARKVAQTLITTLRCEHGAVGDGFQRRVWILCWGVGGGTFSLMYTLQREKL